MPRLSLRPFTTTAAGSWVLGVGADYDRATARTLGANQQLVNQQLFTAAGVTFWVQTTTGVTPLSNTLVTLNDTAPTNDRWDLCAVEVLAGGTPPNQNPPPDTIPPIVNIITPSAGQTVSGSVTVTANATDNVALASVNPSVHTRYWITSGWTPQRATLIGLKTKPTLL
jgi:Big-like domain-containing protein